MLTALPQKLHPFIETSSVGGAPETELNFFEFSKPSFRENCNGTWVDKSSFYCIEFMNENSETNWLNLSYNQVVDNFAKETMYFKDDVHKKFCFLRFNPKDSTKGWIYSDCYGLEKQT